MELLFGACVLVVVTLTLGIGLGGKCKLSHVVYSNSSANQLYLSKYFMSPIQLYYLGLHASVVSILRSLFCRGHGLTLVW